MGFFLLTFILTNLVFSLILGAALLRGNHRGGSTGSRGELLLYSLGLGPIVTSLLLYYLFLLLPRRSHLFYVVVVLAVYTLIAFWARNGLAIIGNAVGELKDRVWQRPATAKKGKSETGTPETGKKSPGRVLYWLLVAAMALGTVTIYLENTRKNPIEGHDALVYGNFGKMFFQKRRITYQKVMTPGRNGFIFRGTQRPSFSLLLTWEMLLRGKGNWIKGVRKNGWETDIDLYFRGISGYYGMLLMALQFLWLYRRNRYLALLGPPVLLASHRFFQLMVDHHLDSFRIFFLVVAWIMLVYTLKEDREDRTGGISFYLLALFSGFAAFAHLIGLVAALLNGAALFVFMHGGFKRRLWRTALFLLILLLTGNVHYLLEILYGSASGFVTYF